MITNKQELIPLYNNLFSLIKKKKLKDVLSYIVRNVITNNITYSNLLEEIQVLKKSKKNKTSLKMMARFADINCNYLKLLIRNFPERNPDDIIISYALIVNKDSNIHSKVIKILNLFFVIKKNYFYNYIRDLYFFLFIKDGIFNIEEEKNNG